MSGNGVMQTIVFLSTIWAAASAAWSSTMGHATKPRVARTRGNASEPQGWH